MESNEALEREIAERKAAKEALQVRELIHELQTARHELLALSAGEEVRGVTAALARGEAPTAAARVSRRQAWCTPRDWC